MVVGAGLTLNAPAVRALSRRGIRAIAGDSCLASFYLDRKNRLVAMVGCRKWRWNRKGGNRSSDEIWGLRELSASRSVRAVRFTCATAARALRISEPRSVYVLTDRRVPGVDAVFELVDLSDRRLVRRRRAKKIPHAEGVFLEVTRGGA